MPNSPVAWNTVASKFAPDFDEAFAKVFGDVIGFQIARAVRGGLGWARASAQALTRDTVDYLQEESRDLVGRPELDGFLDEVDALRERGDACWRAPSACSQCARSARDLRPNSQRRLFGIAGVLMRYRLDDLVELDKSSVTAPLVVPNTSARRCANRKRPRGERLVLALTELGPIFVKFGQILSTRRDLLPPDIADALTALQDNVAPFPGSVARLAVENALAAPIEERFARFDEVPLASASIAQVHPAQLPTGREVVVKVLRPDIHERVARDVELLRALGRLADRMHPNADKIRPLEIVDEIETTLHK